MKPIVLAVGFFIASGAWLCHAGTVLQLGNVPEARGTLTLNATAVHVEGTAASDISLTNLLEAVFSDAPFQLNSFSSTSSPAQLPPGWKGQDLGHPKIAGSAAYADGVLTLTGAGSELQKKENDDQYFVFGQPWTGNGQLTVRFREVDGPVTQSGPMVRGGLDPSAIFFAAGLSAQGGGLFLARGAPGDHVGWTNFSSDMPPIWLRLIRSGNSIDTETSPDGMKWEIVKQGSLETAAGSWLGFFLNSYSETITGKAILDQLSIDPAAAEPATLPPGVLLQSGSFLSGTFHMNDPKSGTLDRNGKTVALTTDQIAAVIIHPVTLEQIADVASQAGMIVKNGDFLATDSMTVNGAFITANSLLLGIVSYYGESVRACVFQPMVSKPSDYEIRLKDGSIVRASNLTSGDGKIIMAEISGVTVDATTDEIAQVRAGLTHVQPLIDLPWKAMAPATPPAPPVAPAAPAVAPALATPPVSEVQSWTGPNQEQILALPAGTSVDFPLSGKVSALNLRMALAPSSPSNSHASIRILADGKEVGRTPEFKAGDQPGLVQLTLSSPRKVTIEADSIVAGTTVLLIDPCAIR